MKNRFSSLDSSRSGPDLGQTETDRFERLVGLWDSQQFLPVLASRYLEWIESSLSERKQEIADDKMTVDSEQTTKASQKRVR
jgi:hypothetical protein